MLRCPECGSTEVEEVPNSTLDIAAKCNNCGKIDFINKFECDNRCSECKYTFEKKDK